jgi:hypothetical protein
MFNFRIIQPFKEALYVYFIEVIGTNPFMQGDRLPPVYEKLSKNERMSLRVTLFKSLLLLDFASLVSTSITYLLYESDRSTLTSLP